MNIEKNAEIEKIISDINLDENPPSEEPYRQYYFIKKCREIIKKKSEEMGRPLFATTKTFGCQMNVDVEIPQSA